MQYAQDHFNAVHYATDTLSYLGSLNPGVASTQFDGAPDNFTMSQTGRSGVHPLALAVTISSATGTSCYPQNIVTGIPFPPQDGVAVSVVTPSGNNEASQLTPLGSTGASYPYCNSGFTFNDDYTLPLDNTQTTFQVSFTLFHQYDVNNVNKGTLTSPTLSLTNGATWSASNSCVSGPVQGTGSCYTVSVQVEPLSRSPPGPPAPAVVRKRPG